MFLYTLRININFMNEQQPNPNQPQAPAEQPVQQPVQQQPVQPQQPAPEYNAPIGGGGNKKTLLIIIIVVVAVLIILAIVGSILLRKGGEKLIEKGFEKAIEKETGGSVDIGLTNKVPDSCPKEIIIYPKADVMGAFCGIADPDSHNIMLFSKDSQEKVSSYYKSELIKNDWQIKDNEIFLMGMITLAYVKDGKVLSIGIMPAQEGVYETTINLDYTPEGMYDGDPGYDYY